MCVLQPLFDAYARAVWDQDVAALLAIYGPEVQAFDMWADWRRDGVGPVRRATEAWFGGLGSDRVRVTFEGVRSGAAGPMAWACAYVRFAAIAPDGAELRAMDNRLTWVAQLGDAQLGVAQLGVAQLGATGWRVVHEHTSAPLDETARAIFAR